MTPTILLGYRRKSLVRNQADLISPERQAYMCQTWVEMQGHGYTIEWYEDIDGHRSGRDEAGRPGWQQLMTQLDRADVVGVIADSFDRMYRNVHQFLTFLNRMEQNGKKLITVKEGLDTTSTLGRAVVTILMVIYQLESDQTSDRMTANIKYKREQLGRHWGPCPFATERGEDGLLIPTERAYWYNPVTGAARLAGESPGPGWELRRFLDGLVAIYRLYATGIHSRLEVTEMVNAAGWRYYKAARPEPRPFDPADVKRALSSWEIYRGSVVLGRAGDGQAVPGGHAPLLPPELCDQVNEVRLARASKHGRSKKKSEEQPYLLSSVLHCGLCGKGMRGEFDRGRRYYRHRGTSAGCGQVRTPADGVEQQVLAKFGQIDSSLMKEVAAEADRLARELFGNDDAGRAIIAGLDQQRERLTRLENLYLDKEIDKPRYLARKAEIDTAIADLEEKLYAASNTINFRLSIDRMMEHISQLGGASVETQRALINSAIERIELTGGQITHLVPRPWARPFF